MWWAGGEGAGCGGWGRAGVANEDEDIAIVRITHCRHFTALTTPLPRTHKPSTRTTTVPRGCVCLCVCSGVCLLPVLL